MRTEGADPFSWSSQPVELRAGATGEIVLDLDIPESCEIYRDRLSVRVLDAPGLEIGEASIPKATAHRKVRDHRVGLLQDATAITLPVLTVGDTAGVQVVTLELTHQGCKGGLCYPEVVQQREALVRIVPATHD